MSSVNTVITCHSIGLGEGLHKRKERLEGFARVGSRETF